MADKTQGQQVITALIIPLSSASPPPRPSPGPTPPGGGGGGELPHPEHPIYWPLPPGVPVDPEYGIPEDGPHPDQGLPGDQPRPDQGLPGPQPKPEHPIVLPPGSGNWLPIYIWGPGDARPTPPIVIPPPDETEDGAKVEWKAAWTPTTGWVSFAVVVPGGSGNVPTPSKRR